eukprot:TRINITY_DN12756_c0_g1_i1.p1 TRINITY_DN12756_c0_g1~~TRINITY_DN12756_c0_g1_i1.p1  ORF type:complete len:149 (-),score=31.54 TRINITY_DN12756_c0_g1_i1:218-664(-)
MASQKNGDFFSRHQDEKWFQEKYDPLVISTGIRIRFVLARATAKDFAERFFDGRITCIDDDIPEVIEPEEKDAKSNEDDENRENRGDTAVNNGETSQTDEGNGPSENGEKEGERIQMTKMNVLIKWLMMRMTQVKTNLKVPTKMATQV